MGSVDRRHDSDRLQSAHADENTDQVNDMVLSQEDEPQTHITLAQFMKYCGRQAFLSHRVVRII